MFTLTGTDETTTNARPLTADEIDLVAGGFTLAVAKATGGPLDFSFTSGVLVYSIGTSSAAAAIATTTAGSSSSKSVAISIGNGTASSGAIAST